MKKIILFCCIFLSLNAQELIMRFNNQTFNIDLYSNESADVFAEKTPMIAKAFSLNTSGKYFYIPEFIPANPKSLKSVKNGDVLLFGNHYIMIYNSDFIPTHEYTRIGKIRNPKNLKEAFNYKTLSIKFSKN